ncbi:MAG: translocation/assembly module TamB domain-containing protein [Balneolaceae bacterium]
MTIEKSHIALRILKFIGWFLLAIIVLVAVLRLSLKTDFVNNFAKNKAVSMANESINGTLSIENIRGDLWKEITATNISLIQQDTLLQIDTLNVSYNVWSFLSGSFTVNEVLLSGFHANIEEEEDQQFNVQNILKESPEDTTAEESTFGFEVENFQLRNSSVSIFSPAYLPDSTLQLTNLNADASFGMAEEFHAALSSLSFYLREGRLPEPIAVTTAASFEDDEVTLLELIIETGRSALRAQVQTDLEDSTISASAKATPFSLADIQPYLDQELPNETFQITIEASGSLAALNITINMEGKGFDDLLLTTSLSVQEEPVIKKMGFSVQNLDAGYFTNDSVDADIGEFQASLEGTLTSEYENANLTWGFSTNQIRYENYNFQQFFGSGTFRNGNVEATVQLKDGNEEIFLYPTASNVFSENPRWRISFGVDSINPAWWAQNSELDGKVSLNGFIKGTGFELAQNPWEFSLQQRPVYRTKTIPMRLYNPNHSINFTADTNFVAGQKFTDIDVSGSITSDSLKVNGGIRLIKNNIAFNAGIAGLMEDHPSYDFWVSSRGFNVSELAGFEDFTTSLNLTAEGHGSSFDMEEIEMEGNFRIDSSYVNGTPFDLLAFNVLLDNEILEIPEGEIESQIMEGSFSARKKMVDGIDPNDELNIDLLLKDLQPIAELLSAERVHAEGPIRGKIRQNGDEFPEFDGLIDLQNIYYDEMFRADAISGETRLSLGDTYDYDVDVNIAAPTITGVTLQDLSISSVGITTPDSVDGNFRIEIQSRDAGEISQMGTFAVNLNTLKSDIRWDVFRFQTPARLLSLESPFHLSYNSGTISTDTLSLISNSGAFLKLAVPLADSLNQEAWVEGQNFDFGIIQEIVFGERFVDGILQGEIELTRNPGFLAANGAFEIRQLSYLDSEIDLFDLKFNIADERLLADGSINIAGEQKIIGSLNAPFVLEDPATLDDSFFEEPVEGSLSIKPLQLSRFSNILEQYNIDETSGMLTFNGSLSGTAGTPAFDGKLNLHNPTLSGIKIDSAFAEFSYDHIEKNVLALAEVHAQGQKAASIHSNLPISVDFRTFEVNTPDETDSIRIDLDTQNFNIAVFNDFLDPQFLTRLKGVLNADVNIEGTMENLVPAGFIRLQQAEVRVPIANILLQKINSEITFTEEGLNLKELSMRSGGGTLNANGTIFLEGLQPVELNISTRARQFKLANTNDYNLTIDLENKLTGSPMRPTASGNLTVRNGFIYLQDFGERSVEAVELEGEKEPSFSPYDSLAIDMQFKIDRNFYVRNSRYLDMEVELTGELEAQKETAGDLQLFGTLTGERGYARPLGKRFDLEEADFTFSGPVEDPNLSIRTSYVPQTNQKEGGPIVLYYIIEGSAQEPEFRFESEPQMEQQDIIAYTLFGRPFYALDSWQQVLSGGGSGSSPTDLLVDVLLDEVEALATRELGIDVVQIDNTRSGSDAVTSIKTGWYLNRRTFFSVVNEISSNPKTLFILEYLLRENLDLIITQGDDNRQGIDIRWQYEY